MIESRYFEGDNWMMPCLATESTNIMLHAFTETYQIVCGLIR